jgi:hypothetical protein
VKKTDGSGACWNSASAPWANPKESPNSLRMNVGCVNQKNTISSDTFLSIDFSFGGSFSEISLNKFSLILLSNFIISIYKNIIFIRFVA